MNNLTNFSGSPLNVPSSDIAYLSSASFTEHCGWLKRRHPGLASLINKSSFSEEEVESRISELNKCSWEFEDQESGRGKSYNVAQQAIDNRSVGMRKLLSLFSRDGKDSTLNDLLILDALAGDGTLRRFVSSAYADKGPEIICADISRFMIDRCVEQDFPCLRQSASKSFIADDQLDGVLIAYGSHHLSSEERLEASLEAFRTLKPGGRFVLHDFPEGGAVDKWFSEIVHPFSLTGHPHRHFRKPEMEELLHISGFNERKVIEISDPFIMHAGSQDDAKCAMLRHLHSMYGLEKICINSSQELSEFEELVEVTLGKIEITKNQKGYTATLNRIALVAVGLA